MSHLSKARVENYLILEFQQVRLIKTLLSTLNQQEIIELTPVITLLRKQWQLRTVGRVFIFKKLELKATGDFEHP